MSEEQQAPRSAVLEWDAENEEYRRRVDTSDDVTPVRKSSFNFDTTTTTAAGTTTNPADVSRISESGDGEVHRLDTALVWDAETEQYKRKTTTVAAEDQEVHDDAKRTLVRRLTSAASTESSDFALPSGFQNPLETREGSSNHSIPPSVTTNNTNGMMLNPRVGPSSQQEEDFLMEASKRLFGLSNKKTQVELRLEARVSPMTDCLRRFYRHYMFESIWLILILIGTLMSILAWCTDELTERLFEIRNAVAKLPSPKKPEGLEKWLFEKDAAASFFIWWAWSLVFGFGAVLVVKWVAPQAAGSGIEQVRSIMTGYSIPGYLEINTLFAKLVGLVCVQASGLTVGKEGPFVHIACSLGNLLLSLPLFTELKKSRALTKQVISAACATGFSSTFGAPVGGVLCAIELTSNVYHTSDYWKAFFCAVCGEVIFRELSYFGTARPSQISLFPTTFPAQPYLLMELPGYIILATFAGLYGGLYVKIIMGIRSTRTRILNQATAYVNEKKRKKAGQQQQQGTVPENGSIDFGDEETGKVNDMREREAPMKTRFNKLTKCLHDIYLRSMYYLLQPLMYAFVVITLTAWLNWFTGQFMKRTLYSGIADLLVSGEMAQDQVLGVSADHRLQSTDWGSPSLLFNLILYFVLKSFLCAIALSLPIPTGTLIPMLAIGLCFGRIWGELTQLAFGPQFIPGGYALVGATAFIAGATGAISTAVIIFEITSQLSYMVPVLVAAIVGRAAGKLLSPDLYEALQMMKNLPNIPPLAHQSSYNILVVEIMNPNNIPMLNRFSTLLEVETVLNAQTFRGHDDNEVHDDDLFAIVDDATHYLASVARHQLRLLLTSTNTTSTLPAGLEGGENKVDLIELVNTNSIAPSVPITTSTIDCLQIFELTLCSAMFVTDKCKVVGWIDLPSFRHKIEHGEL